MTGFAEGFASGYGLMDATLQHQHENKLKQQLIDREDRQDKASADQFDKTYGLQELQRKETARHQGALEKIQQQQADTQADKEKNDNTYQIGMLGAAKQNAANGAATARAAIAAHKFEQSVSEEKLKQLKQENAFANSINYFKINHQGPDGGFTNLPETPEQMKDFVTHAKNAGIDINSMMDSDAYARHLSNTANLLNDFHPNGKPTNMVMTADQAPDQFKSVNHILEPEINRLTGKKQEITAIHSHIGAPEFKGDDGIFYTYSTLDKNGKPQIITNPDGSPVRHRGNELTGGLIDNAKIFDALQSSQWKQAWNNFKPALVSKTEKSDMKIMQIPITDDKGVPTGETRDVGVTGNGEVVDPVDLMKTKANYDTLATQAALAATKQPSGSSQPANSPQVQNIINGLQATQPLNSTQATQPLSRDEAVAKQNEMYSNQAKNRKSGLRGLFLTPEEIAKQDSINR